MENRAVIVTNFNGVHLVEGDEVYVYGSPVLADGPVRVSIVNGDYLGVEGLRKDNGSVDRLYFDRHTGYCPAHGASQLFLGRPTITGPTTFTREVIKQTPSTFANLYDGSANGSQPWWAHHSTLKKAEDGRGDSVSLNPSFVATVELPGKMQEYRQQIDGETGWVVNEEVVG